LDYDDSSIQNKLNDFKERIAALQTKADKLNEDISKLGYLTEGNVITSVSRNSDGICEPVCLIANSGGPVIQLVVIVEAYTEYRGFYYIFLGCYNPPKWG